MALFTSSYLKGVYNQNFRTLNESLQRKTFSAQSTFDIFLSHSFLDREEVLGLYYELTSKGFSVYVDWIVDPQLDRTNVTKDSAALIRQRMASSRTLLLAISHNASVSKWMPWELGFVDGKTSFCAVAPVSKDNVNRTDYRGVEYLSLYPYINRASDTAGVERLWVQEYDGAYILLSEWIKNNRRPYKREY